jgi:putative ABC transport system substrate-binding protein
VKRRVFITLLGGAAAAWPLTTRAQQTAMPVVGFVRDGSADTSTRLAAAFRKGLNETGHFEGQNVAVEYHWLEGLGLVRSLAHPGGNATGINFFSQEVVAKRLRLLHELVPKAVRVAVLVNPANAAVAENTVRDAQQAADAMGLQIQVHNASTIPEIDATFAALSREHDDALFVAADAFFVSRRGQFATLTARDRVPATYPDRDFVAGGGLMSYGADILDMFHGVGIYAGKVLQGTMPADMPVQQTTKFEFTINLQTARALGIEIPSGLLAIADEVIE